MLNGTGTGMIWRIWKWIAILALLGAVALLGYAMLGKFPAPGTETATPVTIDVN